MVLVVRGTLLVLRGEGLQGDYGGCISCLMIFLMCLQQMHFIQKLYQIGCKNPTLI